jgi:hypothetical protein
MLMVIGDKTIQSDVFIGSLPYEKEARQIWWAAF